MHYKRWLARGSVEDRVIPERMLNNHGYVLIRVPGHPEAVGSRVLEHRLVMEQKLGRLLRPEETVHHKNGKRDDNRQSNLELWSSRHPPGQRVQDLRAFAKEILEIYPD